MNEYANKAIIYAVSLFTIMTVITLLVTYFNTAKQVADAANNRMDIAVAMDELENSKENFTEVMVTGVDVRSLVRKHAGDEKVEINIRKVANISSAIYRNVNNIWFNEDISMIDETKLSIINPAMMARIIKEFEGDLVKFNVHLYTELYN